MPAFFVLDVPEFHPLVAVSQTRADLTVSKVGDGYFKVESDHDIILDRKALGFKPAIWYAAFTGGLVGRLVEFERDTLRITDDPERPPPRDEKAGEPP